MSFNPDSIFFADLSSDSFGNDDPLDDDSENDDEADSDIISDNEWLLNTLQALCNDSHQPDTFKSLQKELENRGFLTKPPQEDPVPRTGSPFAQAYRSIEVLQDNEQGQIVKIQNYVDKQIYALKTINVHVDHMNAAVQEITCLAHLNSPRIVRYFSSWAEQGDDPDIITLNILLEYIHGQTLTRFLQNNSDISVDCAHHLIHEIAAGLNEIHKEGIVHRNLCPDNIMIKEDGSVVIIDFRLASIKPSVSRESSAPPIIHQKRIGSLQIRPLDKICINAAEKLTSVRAVGLPIYTSPMQLNSVKSSPKDDIYSLGMIMFEILANFHSDHERQKGLRDLHNKSYLSDAFRVKYPEESEMILSMVNQNRNARPSAADILGFPIIREEPSYEHLDQLDKMSDSNSIPIDIE